MAKETSKDCYYFNCVPSCGSQPTVPTASGSTSKKTFLVTPFAPKAAQAAEPLLKYVSEISSFNSGGGSKKWTFSFCKKKLTGCYSRFVLTCLE
ncbi:hypothetical protein GOP47_0028108 [Adiantum capillus-veneris]|nr:hypothetical protein GOP47_0028108 [Adiantum capillus-veneris]